MNKKIIFSSALVLVLCVSLITGATFALFTSDSETNIAVNSGKVEVVATLEKAEGEWVYSPTSIDYEKETISDATNAADQTTGKFVNGGFATLNEEQLTLTNMTPGDKVMLNIRITNNSTVAVKYATRLWVSKNDGLFEGLKITVKGAPFTYTQQTAWTDMAVGSDDIVIPVVVELPDNAGNEYQSKNATISFSVSAVQANADTDALNNNAPDAVYLYNETDLYMFAKDVENGNNYAGKTVHLLNDIDLGGKEWKPVSQTGYKLFLGNFNGNDHKISNFYIDTTDGVYPENAEVATGFFGWLEANQQITNLKLDNFKVTAYRRPAGVVGYMGGNATVVNCHVSNATIVAEVEPLKAGGYDNGDKAGGITGFMNDNNVVDGCTVSASTICGYRDIGGIVGYSTGTVQNCVVTDINLKSEANSNYKKYTDATEYDVNAIIGEGTATASNNKESGYVNITVKVAAFNDAELAAILEKANDGDIIYLGAGTFSAISLRNKDYNFVGSVDAEGKPTTKFYIEAAPTTIDSAGVWNGFKGSVTNVVFEAADGISDGSIYDGLSLYHTDDDVVAQATFTNCHFVNQGVKFYGVVNFVNCVFDGQNKVSSAVKYSIASGEVVFDNCTFSNYKSVSINIAESPAGSIVVKNSTVNTDVELGELVSFKAENTKFNCNVIVWFAATQVTIPEGSIANGYNYTNHGY